MPQGIKFDAQGRVIIEDAELGRRIVDWLQQGKEISLRVPFPSGTATTVAPVPKQPTPVPIPMPMLKACPNSMCDCPVGPPRTFPDDGPDMGSGIKS